MYIITLLGMVKVYQIRHPDIVTSAHKMYLLFAVIILIAVIGVVSTDILEGVGCTHIDQPLYLLV